MLGQLENTKMMLCGWIPAIDSISQHAVMQCFNVRGNLSQSWWVTSSLLTHLCARKQNIGVRLLLLLSDPPTAVNWEQRWVDRLRLALQGHILSVRPQVCLLPLTHSTTSSQMRGSAAAPSADSSTLQLHSSCCGPIIANELSLNQYRKWTVCIDLWWGSNTGYSLADFPIKFTPQLIK